MDRIDALRVFTKVAELGSFSAAARKCKVKQSTASKWVAELEMDFETTLLQRSTRSLRLTTAGERFLYQARAVLAAFDSMVVDFESFGAELSETLRIAVPVEFGRLRAATALIHFLLENKKVRAEVVLSDRDVNLLDEGFDLAIRVGISPNRSSEHGSPEEHKLFDSRLVLVASTKYLKHAARVESIDDLKNHECLLHADASGPDSWKFRQQDGPWQKIKVGGRVSSNCSWITLEMARAGLGIALLADWLVKEDLKSGELTELLPQLELPSAPVYLLFPPGRFSSRTARALADCLKAILSKELDCYD